MMNRKDHWAGYPQLSFSFLRETYDTAIDIENQTFRSDGAECFMRYLKEYQNNTQKEKTNECEGRDSNPRTST